MIFFYISLSTYICFNIIKYKKSFFALQKNKYSIKEYGKWIFKNYKEVFLNKELLAIILLIITLKFNLKVIGVSTVIFYTLMFLLDYKKKIKLKMNKQMISRIVITILVFIDLNIWFIADYISYHYADIIFDNTALYYIVLILMSYFSHFVVWIVNLIAKPFDRFILKNKKRR